MSDDKGHDREEEVLRGMLRAIENDAARADPQALELIRERAEKQFEESAAAERAERAKTSPAPRETNVPSNLKQPRRSMNSFAVRGMIALAGLAAAIVVALNLAGPGNLTGAAPFSEVIDELRGQQTLELR